VNFDDGFIQGGGIPERRGTGHQLLVR
jgi:hypothetical protein